MTDPDFKHCDAFIDDLNVPSCLRAFLFVARLPASKQMLIRKFVGWPKLFANYGEKTVRVTMASCLGDLGISTEFDQEDGYFTRVPVEALTNYRKEP